MVKKFIIFGEVNKKYLFPFLLAIVQIVNEMVNRYYPEEKKNTVLDIYFTSFGIMTIIFMPKILKFDTNETIKEKMSGSGKRKCLYYSALIFLFIIYSAMKSIPQYMRGTFSEESAEVSNPFTKGAFINIGIEMVFLTTVSIFLLKYKYFRHHVISMILFIILGNICDYVLHYYSHMFDYGPLMIVIQIISIFTDVIYYYYEKYLLEKLYYPYWEVSFLNGITLFTFATMLFIYVITNKDKENSTVAIVQDFYLYFQKVSPGIIIGKQLLVYIIYFINNSLTILIIYYLNPNFNLIGFHLSKIVQVLIDENNEKFYCIIIFILQLFCLMIYLEIIELNFCDLNKNTKRKINLRGIDDLSGDTGSDSNSALGIGNIDIGQNYYIESLENDPRENSIEMSRSETTSKSSL